MLPIPMTIAALSAQQAGDPCAQDGQHAVIGSPLRANGGKPRINDRGIESVPLLILGSEPEHDVHDP